MNDKKHLKRAKEELVLSHHRIDPDLFFHFQLNPIEQIKPWGKKDKPGLHWFGLSDGRYWIQIGEIELFRYSDALLAAYPPKDSALATHPLRSYVDYFVVRLWEDILEVVPDILDPLPVALQQRMEPIDKWLQWCQKVNDWRDDLEELCRDDLLEARRDLQSAALSWWWRRQLYTGPILPSPRISFWSDGQDVHCTWDSRASLHEDGIDTWASVYGTASIPMSTFMEAVTSFDTRFIAAMAERIQIVLANWTRPEIALDTAQLAREQVQRSEHFAKRMSEVSIRAKAAVEWENILSAIEAIEKDPGFLAMS